MHVFPAAVYLLCLLTSLACAVLLVRSYWRGRTKVLLWIALCFVGLAFNNFFLFFDVVVFPTQVDLVPLRHLSTLAAIAILLYGFVWEAE